MRPVSIPLARLSRVGDVVMRLGQVLKGSQGGATVDAYALVCAVKGHAIAAAGLLARCDAAEVARQLRDAADIYEKHGVEARH